MFVIHDYIMKMLKGMVGNYPDWQIMEYALNWYSKGKLTEEDLAEVEGWFENQTPTNSDQIPNSEVDTPTEEVDTPTETEDTPIEE